MRALISFIARLTVKIVAALALAFGALAALSVLTPEPTPEEIAAREDQERIAAAQAEVDAARKVRERFKLDSEIFCARQIASRMKDPEFSAIGKNPARTPNADGGYSFAWDDLTSRNGFGMDVKVEAYCTVDGDGALTTLVINGKDAR